MVSFIQFVISQISFIPSICHSKYLPYSQPPIPKFKGKKWVARGGQIYEYEVNAPSEMIPTLL